MVLLLFPEICGLCRKCNILLYIILVIWVKNDLQLSFYSSQGWNHFYVTGLEGEWCQLLLCFSLCTNQAFHQRPSFTYFLHSELSMFDKCTSTSKWIILLLAYTVSFLYWVKLLFKGHLFSLQCIDSKVKRKRRA